MDSRIVNLSRNSMTAHFADIGSIGPNPVFRPEPGSQLDLRIADYPGVEGYALRSRFFEEPRLSAPPRPNLIELTRMAEGNDLGE